MFLRHTDGRWARVTAARGQYLTTDGIWWRMDDDTLSLLRYQEHQRGGGLPRKLGHLELHDILGDHGYGVG